MTATTSMAKAGKSRAGDINTGRVAAMAESTAKQRATGHVQRKMRRKWLVKNW